MQIWRVERYGNEQGHETRVFDQEEGGYMIAHWFVEAGDKHEWVVPPHLERPDYIVFVNRDEPWQEETPALGSVASERRH